MNKFLSYSLLLLFSLTLPTFFNKTYAQDNETLAETVVHLLSYVSMDYPGAVKDGKVLDEQEYNEQVEFSEQAYKLIEEGTFLKGKKKKEILGQVQLLMDRIAQKEAESKISGLSTEINDEIIKASGIQTAPKVWPNYENGRKLYEANCTQCHGIKGKGDGSNAASLNPAPSDFHDSKLMENFSPYQAYNSI